MFSDENEIAFKNGMKKFKISLFQNGILMWMFEENGMLDQKSLSGKTEYRCASSKEDSHLQTDKHAVLHKRIGLMN